MAQELRTIGTEEGLRFTMRFGPSNTDRSELAWGSFQLDINGDPVWAGDEGGISWTLVDFLEFLSSAWWPLVTEESWPVAEHLAWPTHLQSAAESRWEDLDESEVDAEEDQLELFYDRHDLARAFKGLFLPSVVVVRHGQLCLIEARSLKLRCIRPLPEVISVLEDVGNLIAEHLTDSSHPRAQLARNKWNTRMNVSARGT